MSTSLQLLGVYIAHLLLSPWDSPSKNTGMGSISSTKGSSWPRGWTCISYVSSTGRQVLYLGSGKPGYHLGSDDKDSAPIQILFARTHFSLYLFVKTSLLPLFLPLSSSSTTVGVAGFSDCFPGSCYFTLNKVKVKVAQSCPTLCDPVDYTVHGILQAEYWSE